MNILNQLEAKLAWAKGELLLVNNTERNGWEPFNPYDFGFDVFDKFDFQLKPRTIFIGEYEVPEPLREAPVKGTTCSFPSPDALLGVRQFKWNDSYLRLLNHGQVHLSFENALTHCIALIKISGGDLSEDILKLLDKPVKEECLQEDPNYEQEAQVKEIAAEEKPKKKRSTKVKNDVDQTSEPAGPGDTIPNIEKSVEAEPVQVAEKWIDPEELKKQYLLRLHKLTTTEEVMQLRYEINPDNRLSKTQINYLNVAAEQQIAKIEKAVTEQATTPAEELGPENVQNSTSNDVEEKTISVDELKRLQKEAEALIQEKKQTAESTEQPIHIFSATKRDQMIEHILNLNTTEALEKYAPAITAAKPSMHPEHHIAVLNAYSKRKVTLDQLDLLGESGVQEA